MSRPLKEGLDYFPHDTRLEDNIKVMVAKYGLAGHGFYFSLLERIYQQPDGELDLSDEDLVGVIISDFHLSKKKFLKMLETAIKHQLFDEQLFRNFQRLSSNGVKKRRNCVESEREYARRHYSKAKLNKGVLNTRNPPRNDLESTQRKEKKSKVNIPPIVPLAVDKKFARVVTAYENCMGPVPSTYQKQELEELMKEFSPDWIEDAFKEASRSATKPNLKYVRAILERKSRDGGNKGNSRSPPEEHEPDPMTDWNPR